MHPEFAAKLAAFFANQDEVAQMARVLAAPVSPAALPAEALTLAPGEAAMPPPGTLVRYFGDYELQAEIARGGMGVVYKARQVSLNRLVALKMILAGQLASPDDVRRFRTEAEAAANLDHPNIVPIYEVGEYEGQHYFSMRLIEGESLSSCNRESKTSAKQQRQAAQLMATVARAVHHANQRGIIHRDLKPGNILLDENGEPHVTDFGLAKRVTGDSKLTRSGAIVGTPSYMSPEQARGEKGLSVAADVYSLGSILYELLTGRPPFTADGPLDIVLQVLDKEPGRLRAVNPTIDRDLETICLKCLEKESTKRYASAAAMADDLERWLNGEAILARPTGVVRRTVKWAKRRPASAALVGVSALSAVLLLVGLAVSNALIANKQHQTQDALNEKRAALDREREALQQAHVDRRKADALRLTAQSTASLPANPGLALLLAVEGTAEADRVGDRRAAHNNALIAALQQCRETRVLHAPPVQAEKLLPGHLQFERAGYSPDGRRIAVIPAGYFLLQQSQSSYDIALPLCIFDTVTGQLATKLWVPGLAFTSFAFSPDSRLLAATLERNMIVHYADNSSCLYTDRAARLFDATSGKELHVFKGHEDRVISVAFSPDGRRLLTASWDGSARLWDVETGKELHVFPSQEPQSLRTAFFSPDGKHILTQVSPEVQTSGRGIGSETRNAKRVVFRDGLAGAGKMPASVDPPVRTEGLKRIEFFYVGSGSVGGSYSSEVDSVPAHLWEADTGRHLAVLDERGGKRSHNAMGDPAPVPANPGKQGTTTMAAFTPDGRSIITGHIDAHVRVWDAVTGAFVRRIERVWAMESLEQAIASTGPVAFGPDGKRVLLHRATSAVLVDHVAGKELATFKGPSFRVRGATLSPDGRQVLLLFPEPYHKIVAVHDAATGKELTVLRGHDDEVTSVAFRPDGRQVITASRDGTARLWDVETGTGYGTVLFRHVEMKPLFRLNSDGRRALSAIRKAGILWNPTTGGAVATLKGEEVPVRSERDYHLGDLIDAQFGADGRRLVTVAADRCVCRENNGKDKEPVFPFTPVRIWDAESGKLLLALRGFRFSVRSAAFSADGRRLLTISDNRNNYVSLMANGNWGGAGSGGYGGPTEIRVWDAATGQQQHVLRGEMENFDCAVWHPDSRRLLIASSSWIGKNYTYSLRMWDAEGAKETMALEEIEGGISEARFSPDGRYLMGIRSKQRASKDKIVVWKLATGHRHASLDRHLGDVFSARFSPSGREIVSTAADGTARIWDVDTGHERLVLRGHEKPVQGAAFSPDARWVVTAAEDNLAKVWDVDSGAEWLTLTGHQASLWAAEFTPDGKHVLTAASDGTVRKWPIDPLPSALVRKPRELTEDERRRYEVPESALVAPLAPNGDNRSDPEDR